MSGIPILDQIIERTRRGLVERRAETPIEALLERAQTLAAPLSLAKALRQPGRLTCISEFKRRSPSVGWIREQAEAAAVASAYEAAGAAAISVLTEPDFFGGSLNDLKQVKATVGLPILRKDFIVDGYQVVEARAAGADCILLIVAALRDEELATLLAQASNMGMDALVETHDEDEVRRALAVGAQILGINHRDLRTFTMDMDLALRMRPRIPADRLVVAESGIKVPADVARMKAGGIDAILVGEGLMREADPGLALQQLLAAA